MWTIPTWWLWLGLWCLSGHSSVMAKTTAKSYLRHFNPGRLYPDIESQKWFSQQLDHFNPEDENEWKQRYWVNAKSYRKGGPVFLFIGGEWKETGFSYRLTEPWEENAVRRRALMFKLEHRFYGDSQPTSGNFTVENLKYLSIPQALADLANFIVSMNRQFDLPSGTRWVVFGCSYSATLAVWLRYKYPHLVYAAVAYSAPINVKVNYPEYYDALEGALSTFYGSIKHNETLGTQCVEAFREARREVSELLKTPEGINLTRKYFQFHDSLDIDWNSTSLENPKLADDVGGEMFYTAAQAVQFNYYMEDEGVWPIERFCDTLLDDSSGEGTAWRYGFIHRIFDAESDPGDKETDRQWSYQTCSELGLFGTIEDEDPDVLGLKVQHYFDYCAKTFGKRFSEKFIRERVDRTNTMYGGRDIDVQRVIYTYGTLDPWAPSGMDRTKNPLSPVYTIKGASHCMDTMPRTYYDSDDLLEARQFVTNTLKYWLARVYNLKYIP